MWSASMRMPGKEFWHIRSEIQEAGNGRSREEILRRKERCINRSQFCKCEVGERVRRKNIEPLTVKGSMLKETAENGFGREANVMNGESCSPELLEVKRSQICSAVPLVDEGNGQVIGGNLVGMGFLPSLSLDDRLRKPLTSQSENSVELLPDYGAATDMAPHHGNEGPREAGTEKAYGEGDKILGGAIDLVDTEKECSKVLNGGVKEIVDLVDAGEDGSKVLNGDLEETIDLVDVGEEGSKVLNGGLEEIVNLPLPTLPQEDKRGVNGGQLHNAEEMPLSKSALKQLAKQERYKEVKMQKKALEKERRHQETARKRSEWQEKLAMLTEDEKEEARLQKLSVRNERKEEERSRKQKLRDALNNGQNLVIDLEFSHLMKPTEISSTIQQVMYSYAANARAVVPARISLTGINGAVLRELQKISGFENWLLHREERSYLELFQERHSDLVYLTADSENVIESLDAKKIYIIGGLVDRNRWKNVTLEKARQQGIATAKLPVGDHMKMMASQVLTTNQVVELLLSFLGTADWKKALLQVVPPRKRGAEGSLKQ